MTKSKSSTYSIILFIYSCFIGLGINFVTLQAQETYTKTSRKFNIGDTAVVSLHTSHTNVVYETWNRNYVLVEAHIKSALPQQKVEELLSQWDIQMVGSPEDIRIKSTTRATVSQPLAYSSRFISRQAPAPNTAVQSLVQSLLEPIIQQISLNPLPEPVAQMNKAIYFDYELYQREGEAYKQRWQQFVSRYLSQNGSPMSPDAIQDWITRFNTNLLQSEKNVATTVRYSAPKVSAVHSNWVQPQIVQYEMSAPLKKEERKEPEALRIITIKAPKNIYAQLSVRHGKVEVANTIYGLRARLSHTQLEAEEINGEHTIIQASYSPVFVRNWNKGALTVDYVRNCRLDKVESIKLTSNASNVYINSLRDNGVISSSFGVLTIAELNDTFAEVNIRLHNGDLKLEMPDKGYRLNYLGMHSKIETPSYLEKTILRNSGGTEALTAFRGDSSSSRKIIINADYSHSVLH